MNLKKMMATQKAFSDTFFDASSLTEAEKIDRHKTFCLSMHSEISQLANTVHYQDHRPTISPTHRANILFETMDVYRYCLSILNLWGFSAEDATKAFAARDAHLNSRAEKSLARWDGKPIVVVDVDDVLANFRERFYRWVNQAYDADLTELSPEYFFTRIIAGKSGDQLLAEFVEAGEVSKLDVCENLQSALHHLRASGYWIHILTARPADELKCLYETYAWLLKNVEFDSLALFPEKYIHLAATEPFKQGKVICAIDDSPKHAGELAHHGIHTFVPMRSYNQAVWNQDNITTFMWEDDDVAKLIYDFVRETEQKK